jgi:hypothetical protein
MIGHLLRTIEPYKYRILLFSSIAIIFTLPIPSETIGYELIYAMITSFMILAGMVVVQNKPGWRNRIILILGLVLILIQILDLITPFSIFESLMGSLFVIFFIAISIRVYKDLFLAKEIDLEIIAAVFCGYIFIGFLATFLFMTIEGLIPGSFSGMVNELTRFDNFLYFSFISLLTIGYGDMVPLTSLTKSMVVILGLTGNFYTVIVTGIIIGKFLLNYKPGSDD